MQAGGLRLALRPTGPPHPAVRAGAPLVEPRRPLGVPMTGNPKADLVAVFFVGAWVGGVGGGLAGLVCGWGAGRAARGRSLRQAKRDYLAARRDGAVTVIDNPGGQAEYSRWQHYRVFHAPLPRRAEIERIMRQEFTALVELHGHTLPADAPMAFETHPHPGGLGITARASVAPREEPTPSTPSRPQTRR